MEECELVKFESNGKFGMRTCNGEIVVPAQYDDVCPIANNRFAVKQDTCWGIYNADSKTMDFESEYNDIRYEGGNTIMLCKEGLWGAKDLIPLDNDYIGVDIPFEYKEIKPLDKEHSLFSVQIQNEPDEDTSNSTYTIVNQIGTEEFYPHSIKGAFFSTDYDYDGEELCFDSHFEYFSHDFIIASIKNKLGIISLYRGQGVIKVPFIFDEILKRVDSNFNVRIGHKWGVLTPEGKEMVTVKYLQTIPNEIDNSIVTNAETGRMGVLGADGREKVPSIFNCIHITEQFIFVGLSECSDNECPSTPFDCKDGWLWGCWSKNGKMLIPTRYEFFDFNNIDNVSVFLSERYDEHKTPHRNNKGWMFAARDGEDIYEEDIYENDSDDIYVYDSLPSYRDNVYDLYDINGELIIGNFERYEIIEDLDLLKILVDIRGSHYGWIILDQSLRSVVTDDKGIHYQFPRGFLFAPRISGIRKEEALVVTGGTREEIVAETEIKPTDPESFEYDGEIF